MIVAQLRIGGESEPPVALHPALTVLSGLDASARKELASELAGALRGEPANVAVEIEVDGKREWLGPEVVQRLGLQAATAVVVVESRALPGAEVPPPPPGPPPVEGADVGAFRHAAVAAEAAQAAASAAVAEAEAGLAAAATRAAAATEAVAAAAAAGDAGRDEAGAAGADEAVVAGRARLEQANQDLTEVRSALAGTEAAQAQKQQREEAAAAEPEQGARLLQRLSGQQSELEQARAELVARLAAIRRQDLAPVQQALLELQRLRAIRPVPSAAAIQLAEQWVAARKRLAELPAPPEPPEWLVAPAEAALHEAREALTRAEAGTKGTAADARLVEALDRAHRQVLEAEQKMMRKGTRLRRRRLDEAYEAEQAALLALGVTSYGDYLQRMAPSGAGAATPEDPAAAARAALADAEAVWEELHGGMASPEWAAAKEEEDELRAQAQELLGQPVPDAQLAAALRGHQDGVVDVKGAEEALTRALGAPEGGRPGDHDPEQAAQRWLEEAEASNNARSELERQLAELDRRLESLANEVSEHQADAFFGTSAGAAPAGQGGDQNRQPPLSTATAQVQKAEQEELEAQGALAGLEQQAALQHERRERSAHLRSEAQAAREAVRAAAASLNDARQAQEAAQCAGLVAAEAAIAAEAAPAPAPAPAAPEPEADLTGVTALGAEIYLLARLAALQGGPQGPLPLFVDATTVARLSEPAGRRALALLERAAGPVQVVFLGDDGPVGEWARRKGAGAAVVAATRPPQQSRR